MSLMFEVSRIEIHHQVLDLDHSDFQFKTFVVNEIDFYSH